MKPTNNPTQYKDIVRGIATKAEERIREALTFNSNTTITVHKLEKELKHPVAKELSKTLSLPDNTPDDYRKFIKSE